MSWRADGDKLFDINGRRIVVAGGTGGIGFSVASCLLERGAMVDIWDLNWQDLESARDRIRKSIGVEPGIHKVNVATSEEVEEATALVAKHGPIHGLFNAVGISSQRKSVLEITQQEWEQMIAVNLTGAWNLSRAIGRQMVRNEEGVMVHVSSTNAIDPSLGIAHYCVSKAGIGMLVQSLALEWARYSVRVNGIGPGPIITPMTEPILQHTPGLRAEWESKVPMNRLGTPEDLLGVSVFLLSDASRWMTGQTVYVEGGWLL